MNRNEFKDLLVSEIKAHFGDRATKRKEVIAFIQDGIANKDNYTKGVQTTLNMLEEYKVARGLYNFSNTNTKPSEGSGSDGVYESKVTIRPTSNLNPETISTDSLEDEGVVPEKDPLFVPFGFHSKLKKIIKSGIFYPIFITGMSGNGKTKSVQQACAESNRELIRVNITAETDENDLMGGLALVNGNTVYEDGPVIKAMRRGACLLLDECDLGSVKIMCLQSVLEGSPYHIKKTGELVKPAPGFTVVATANTKGKGSDDGRFIGTNIMNEAFLERFVITVEQEYPSEAQEKKMLAKLFERYDINDEDFVAKLVKWAKLIRDGFLNGSVDELITTRRLVHIAKTYAIFGDKLESIRYCLNRFDDESKAVFLDSYTKIDADVSDSEQESSVSQPETMSNTANHPF